MIFDFFFFCRLIYFTYVSVLNNFNKFSVEFVLLLLLAYKTTQNFMNIWLTWLLYALAPVWDFESSENINNGMNLSGQCINFIILYLMLIANYALQQWQKEHSHIN